MFVTLSEYKKRCDSVLKIAQIISKAYDKNRFKKLIADKIDKEISDNILKILNDYRKTNNLSEISKDELRNLILSNLNWKHLWFDLDGLKATMKRHVEYCLKNNYSELLAESENHGYDGIFIKSEQLEKERKSNPKTYYSNERAEAIGDAIQYLNNYDYNSPKICKNFVCEICPGPYPIKFIPNDFDKNIYGVDKYRQINDKKEIKIEKKLFSKKFYPPNLFQLIIDETWDKEIDDKAYEGFVSMKKYGFILAGTDLNHDFDFGYNHQLQLIDWVADSRFKI